jgi:hypothetical protein
MLLVPTHGPVGKTDPSLEKLLRRLDALLPDDWVIVGAIPSMAVSDTGRRGRTKPLDAVVLGSRTIFLLDIRSYPGLIAVRDKAPFQADGKDIDHKDNLPHGFWESLQKEAYKLKVLLKERFDVDTIRVVPKIVWARSQRFDFGDSRRDEDVTDARAFARLAVRRDRAAALPVFPRELVAAIARFLMDDQDLALDRAAAAPQPDADEPEDRGERVRELAAAEWVPVKAGDSAAGAPEPPPALKIVEREPPAVSRSSRWLWLVAALVLLGAIAVLAVSRIEPADAPPRPAPPVIQPAPPAPPPSLPTRAPVQPFAAPQVYVVNGQAVLVRAGPGPEFPTVTALRNGEELVATGTARGDVGSTWLAVSVPGGATGFVPDGMVRPKESAPAVSAAPAPAAEGGKAAGVDKAKGDAGRASRRKAAPKQAAAEGASTVACILPSGEEMRTSYDNCRARAGVIYR